MMLEKLEMFKVYPEKRQLVGEMYMLEDMLVSTFWGGAGQKVDLLVEKHGKWFHPARAWTPLERRVVSYSDYLLKRLFRCKGYFWTNETARDLISFYSHEEVKY